MSRGKVTKDEDDEEEGGGRRRGIEINKIKKVIRWKFLYDIWLNKRNDSA